MADKLKMQSSDIILENIEYIACRWPNVVKEVKNDENKVVKMIDFDALKQELSREVISDRQERYQMTWPDKKKAVLLANSSICGTLRPILDKSVDFNNTENIYIEGDNLDVLKLLRETYLGKIKMIYIDPPYNTGNDFVYNDNFAESEGDYLNRSGQFDSQGNRLFTNSESNGRYHTDWLNMMYPRLKVAKDLLSDDGCIFISIDENEIDNLTKIGKEIFSENNLKASFVWRKTHTQTNIGDFARVKEYILCFTKDIKKCFFNKIPLTNIDEYRYKDEYGEKFRRINLIDSTRGRYEYEITNPNGNNISGKWMKPKEEVLKMISNGEVYWAGETPYGKNYLKTMLDKGQIANDFLGIEYGTNQRSTMHLDKLMGNIRIFDFSKPVELLTFFIKLCTNNNDTILDFFSGSATTAHAVMKLNSEDNGNRKFIMVQLPEICDEKSEAYKAGYKTICDIGEERIRRAGNKIKEEAGILASNLDIGFRVLKLDSTNMKDVYYNPKGYLQSTIDKDIDNVKEDRTSLDLLFQVMLELGIELSSKITSKTIDNKVIYFINDNYLAACFDTDITDNVIKFCANIKPIYIIFRDASFKDDSSNINCEQIIKTISPSTELKVI